jgi:hypothetical protein
MTRCLSIDIEIPHSHRLPIVESLLLPLQDAWFSDWMLTSAEPTSNKNISCPCILVSESILFMAISSMSKLGFALSNVDSAWVCRPKLHQLQFPGVVLIEANYINLYTLAELSTLTNRLAIASFLHRCMFLWVCGELLSGRSVLSPRIWWHGAASTLQKVTVFRAWHFRIGPITSEKFGGLSFLVMMGLVITRVDEMPESAWFILVAESLETE